MEIRFVSKSVILLFCVFLLVVACKQQGAEEKVVETQVSVNEGNVQALNDAASSIAATGRVELASEKSFSPVQGVVCENSGAEQCQATGICYDVNGPSLAYTQLYLSDVAAAALNAEFQTSGRPLSGAEFTTLLGLTCMPAKEQCRAAQGFTPSDRNVVEYNTALYAFPAPPPPDSGAASTKASSSTRIALSDKLKTPFFS